MDTGAEFAVVVVDDYSRDDEFGVLREKKLRREFARELFDLWGIGRKGINDGMLLMLFKTGRRCEMLCGEGLTKQGLSSQIVNTH